MSAVAVTDRFVSLAPAAATDWLLRTVLPNMLRQSGRSRQAQVLAHLPEVTPGDIRDRYAFISTARLLRETREELMAALRDEWLIAEHDGIRLTITAHGGANALRCRYLPHLDEISGFVRATLEHSGVGRLLQLCIELSINLILASNDNDGHGGDALAYLSGTYLTALGTLHTRETPAPPAPVAPGTNPRVRVETVLRMTSSKPAFQGVYVTADSVTVCGHRHADWGKARDCAARIPNRKQQLQGVA